MESKLLDISIVTPDRTVFAAKAQAVWLPGSKSPFEVLYNHAPIVSSLVAGELKIRNETGEMLLFDTGKGFAEISNNSVNVLIDSAKEK